MPTLALAVPHETDFNSQTLESLAETPAITRILLIGGQAEFAGLSSNLQSKARVIAKDFFSGAAINEIVDEAGADYVLLILPGERVQPGQRIIERFLSVAEDTDAGLVYSDFKDVNGRTIA